MPREYEFAEPAGGAEGMRIPIDNYAYLHWAHDEFDVGHYFDGHHTPWVKNLWVSGLNDTPWDKGIQEGFLRLRRANVEESMGSYLDTMTMKDYYERTYGMPPEITAYYDPIMASIIGLGCDAISAYWGLHFSMPAFTLPPQYPGDLVKSFPGGNAGIARHFVKKLIPSSIDGNSFSDILFGNINFDRLDQNGSPMRMRLNSTVVRVAHKNDDSVLITYTNDNRVHQLRAKTVIMASGGWVNKHVMADLPQSHHTAYESFYHSPVLVANVALTNWRFIERLGVPAAIWSGGFGFTCNIRRPMVVDGKSQPCHPDEPTVMTFYAPIYKPGLPPKQQGVVGRAEMLGTSFTDYERQIREQMSTLFAAGGFDARNDIAGIILNRWGHAYVNPGPGFFFSSMGRPPPPDVIREPVGRIAIAHSELRGHQNWTGATAEGRRAVEALIDSYF